MGEGVWRARSAGSNPAGVTTETGLVVPARTRPKDPRPEVDDLVAAKGREVADEELPETTGAEAS
jgi:hypothetical protein